MGFCTTDERKPLKLEELVRWLESEWMSTRVDQNLRTLWVPNACTHDTAVSKFDPLFPLANDYHFAGFELLACPVAPRITHYDDEGRFTDQTGAFLFRFVQKHGDKTVEVPVLSAHHSNESWEMLAVAAVPADFMAAWTDFTTECVRLSSARTPTDRVVIIGGHSSSFVPTTQWDEVVLPPKLKAEILEDVSAFFRKGVEVYRRLNLKPFRKLLLAGVPGTGKTMLCSALARWALDQNYLVIYVSSAKKRQNDPYGSTFDKIDYALAVAARSQYPTLILLEELDAYLHEEEKALILNVLDGSESAMNENGTLLVSTTNYPEAIDERIMKRPGRLDRIFIIPETRERSDAEKMLRQYLGGMWREEHAALVPQLVGYPGAFIREVAVCALTQLAYVEGEQLPLELLERSYKSLKEQIDARDDFLTRKGGIGFSVPEKAESNGSNGHH
ncbi:MAG: ATP-binding protein [Chloroflexi bacterium]|nr:ATP-binding protein [Chloroflexota bacterium]